MLRRSLVTLVLASLSACISATMLIGPVVEPRSVPVLLDSEGMLTPIKLKLYVCDAIEAGLRFQRKSISSDDELRRLIGSAERTKNDQLGHPGLPVKLRINMKRVEKAWFGPDRLVDFQMWEYTTKGVDSYPQDHVFRGAGRKTMPRGEYQVEATLLEAVPALQHVSTEFFVGSNFKIGPNKEKCS